jgi:hypothetical protein
MLHVGNAWRGGYAEHAVVAPTLTPMAVVGSRGLSEVQCVEVASIVYSPHANASHCCGLEIRPLSLRGLLPPSLHFALCILLHVLLQEKFGEFHEDELGVEMHGVLTTRKPRIYDSGTNC